MDDGVLEIREPQVERADKDLIVDAPQVIPSVLRTSLMSTMS
jgi:hypothetical protein